MEHNLEIDETNKTGEYHGAISLRDVSPVDVRVHNITVTINDGSNRSQNVRRLLSSKPKIRDEEGGSSPTVLLENVSAEMPRGSLTAIIGASGSGKTTL